jgi:hypothetical protein
MTTFISSQALVGADLNNTSSAARFALGTRVDGSQDSQWVYVLANGAISVGDCVQILAAGTATRATTSGLRTGTDMVGFAQNAFATGEYGWVATRGYDMIVAVSATVQPGTLYIATTSGKLSNTSASSTITGVLINNASATATTTTTTATLTWPRSIVQGS